MPGSIYAALITSTLERSAFVAFAFYVFYQDAMHVQAN
jgi:hypothetical protein